MRILIVGAGLFGATCARILLDRGWQHDEVVVIDKASHVAGHCHTPWNRDIGCYMHEHGAHIFHTDDEEVWAFVNRFAKMEPFSNRVKAEVKGRIYPLPINLMTLHQVFGVTSPDAARAAVTMDCRPIREPANMEEWCLANMGKTLYEMFVKGYTTKQWGKRPDELPASIIKRLPIRFNFDDRYFSHRHEAIPGNGYTSLVERMLEGATVRLNEPFSADLKADRIIFTGPLDELLGYELGELQYRSLAFDHRTFEVADYQGAAVINYPSERVPFTRIIEHKHFMPASLRHEKRTVISFEKPIAWERGLERFYPVVTDDNLALHREYVKAFKSRYPNALVGGRLGLFKYMDMDQTIRAAFDLMQTQFFGEF